ncbi:unnamed protein product [marine sediment metagenome]|uniref:Uncharacterized protein n=1 Tax=marine sediment metagenome TaxID=412755 RepID=X1D2D7_9ZZZZ
MVKTKIYKSPDGKIKTKIPIEDIKKAYCPFCEMVMDVDQDGTCMECQTSIAYPAISFEKTKFTEERVN